MLIAAFFSTVANVMWTEDALGRMQQSRGRRPALPPSRRASREESRFQCLLVLGIHAEHGVPQILIVIDQLSDEFELAKRAAELFEKQPASEKRRLLDFVVSNST